MVPYKNEGTGLGGLELARTWREFAPDSPLEQRRFEVMVPPRTPERSAERWRSSGRRDSETGSLRVLPPSPVEAKLVPRLDSARGRQLSNRRAVGLPPRSRGPREWAKASSIC